MGETVDVVIVLLNRRIRGRATGGIASRGTRHVVCKTKDGLLEDQSSNPLWFYPKCHAPSTTQELSHPFYCLLRMTHMTSYAPIFSHMLPFCYWLLVSHIHIPSEHSQDTSCFVTAL